MTTISLFSSFKNVFVLVCHLNMEYLTDADANTDACIKFCKNFKIKN